LRTSGVIFPAITASNFELQNNQGFDIIKDLNSPSCHRREIFKFEYEFVGIWHRPFWVDEPFCLYFWAIPQNTISAVDDVIEDVIFLSWRYGYAIRPKLQTG